MWWLLALGLIISVIISIRLKIKLTQLTKQNKVAQRVNQEFESQLNIQQYLGFDYLPEIIIIINKSLQVVYIHPLAQVLFSQESWNSEKLERVNKTLIEGKLGIGLKEVILVSEFTQWIEGQVSNNNNNDQAVKNEQEFVLSSQASSWLKSEQTKESKGESAWLLKAVELPNVKQGKEPHYLIHINEQTEARRLLQTKQDFIAHASHELKTPLTILLGYLEILAENADTYNINKQGENLLLTAQEQGEKLQLLTQQMLNLSKFESNIKSMLKLEDIVVRDIFNQVAQDLQSLIKDKKAELIFTVSEGVPEDLSLHGDRFYWQQIFYNLFENALKQNKAGFLKIELNISKNKDKIIISVIDNGIGISSMDLPYIFNRFYSVDKNYGASKIRGAGLGLSIVKRALLAHDADIEIESIPGQRTAFIISLIRSSIK